VSDEELLDAKQIAALFGFKSHMFAHDKMKADPAFPKPVVTASSVGLCKMGKKFLWRRGDILEYQKLDAQRQKDADGRRLGRNGKIIKLEQRQQAFAGETAVQFITGLFDPAFAQKQRLRRIEKARKNNVKNQKQIRTQGDWQ
jgi:predicted DNA-binding transcriptional regulator AlpA